MAQNDSMDDPDRCTATARSTGERCKQPAIPGGDVCRFHGGSAPQVQQKAQERLDEMADSVTARVQQNLDDLADAYEAADDVETRLEIEREIRQHWVKILDRTGHGPTETREVTGEDGGALELSINETVVETGYDDE